MRAATMPFQNLYVTIDARFYHKCALSYQDVLNATLKSFISVDNTEHPNYQRHILYKFVRTKSDF